MTSRGCAAMIRVVPVNERYRFERPPRSLRDSQASQAFIRVPSSLLAILIFFFGLDSL